jgi:CheY-like chemotaxis protein
MRFLCKFFGIIMKDILLVEDEEVQRILYEEELTDSGYEVRSASSGKEALKLLKKNVRI